MGTTIDAASFTFIRILSGAVWRCYEKEPDPKTGNWASALALFAYAAAFSFAYISPASTGALLLFGAVRATMIIWGLSRGEPLRARQWLGLALAVGGLVALLFPGLSAPPINGAFLKMCWNRMGILFAGGRGTGDPLTTTAGNFLPSRRLCFDLEHRPVLPWATLDCASFGYAALSGAIASGVGYVIWYSALPELKAAVPLRCAERAGPRRRRWHFISWRVDHRAFSPRIHCRPRRNCPRCYRENAGRSAWTVK